MAVTPAQKKYSKTAKFRASQQKYRTKPGVLARINALRATPERRARNLVRDRETHKKWVKAHPEQVKAHTKRSRERRTEANRADQLRNKFNLTLQEYETLLIAQNGVCALCHRPERVRVAGKVRRLSVDHDHVTGKVRGLLCMRCNTLLGYADEAVETLLRAVDYLKRHA